MDRSMTVDKEEDYYDEQAHKWAVGALIDCFVDVARKHGKTKEADELEKIGEEIKHQDA
jgi:hypothetical protein